MNHIEEKYLEKIGANRIKMAHYANESPKQRLVTLKHAGHITQIQLTALARRMDQLVAAGEPAEDAMDQALVELTEGQLAIKAKDPHAPGNVLTLAQLREKEPDLPAKQELLELRNAGSISPQQTKACAALVTQGRTVDAALLAVGATHVLDIIPSEDGESGDGVGNGAEVDGDGDKIPAAAGDDSEPSDDGGETPEDPPEDTEDEPTVEELDAATKAQTLLGLIELGVDDIESKLPMISAKPAITELYCLEMAGKSRVTLLPSIVGRASEIGVSKDELDQAWAIFTQRVADEVGSNISSPKARD